MATDGAGRWTLAVLGGLAAAWALSRLASPPPVPSALFHAIAQAEPSFDADAYDVPLLGRSAALWPERGYLTPAARLELLANIERGLGRVEDYVSRTVEDEYGRGTRVHYFAGGSAFISHTLGGYKQRDFRQPVVFLSFASERRAPYLHESVHIVAPDWSALWLREGLAVFLSRRESEWPMLLRFAGQEIDANGPDPDAQARTCLATAAGQAAWHLVGRDGVPHLPNRDIRTAFYLLSGVLVERLDASCGRKKLMAVYRSRTPTETLEKLTGRPIDSWKGEWVH